MRERSRKVLAAKFRRLVSTARAGLYRRLYIAPASPLIGWSWNKFLRDK